MCKSVATSRRHRKTAHCRTQTRDETVSVFRREWRYELVFKLQVVYDITNNAIALRRHFGPALKIRSVFDMQIAFEAQHGGVCADILSVLTAFDGKDDSTSNAVRRCRLLWR